MARAQGAIKEQGPVKEPLWKTTLMLLQKGKGGESRYHKIVTKVTNEVEGNLSFLWTLHYMVREVIFYTRNYMHNFYSIIN